MTPDRRRHLRLIPDRDARAQASQRRFGPKTDARHAALAAELPEMVRDEMARAAELWQSLQDEGKQLRYTLNERTGRVSVELCDLAGEPLQAVPLVNALGPVKDDSSAA